MERPKVKDPKLFAAIKRFLVVYLTQIRSRSTHTVKAYRDTINLFTTFLEMTRQIELERVVASDFNQENVMKFLQWLEMERGCSEATRNQRLVCIRALSRYLSREKIIAVADYAKIEEIETFKIVDKALSDLLSLKQMASLLKLPDKSKPIGIRDHAFIALLYDIGCRNDEILNMKFGDFTTHKDGTGEVGIIGKGRKFRSTPISVEAMDIFQKYADHFHPEHNVQKPLFYIVHGSGITPMSPDNSARILLKYEKLARKSAPDLPHLHQHLFRHARAMHLYQAGMPLSLVGEWLGHSNLETTMIYAYADTEMKRKAAEKIQEANGTIFTGEAFKYQDNKEVIKKLYGLA